MTRSITELRASGISLEPNEAIAITQQLIVSLLDHDGADEVEPPYGPPVADNVFLQEDGSVVCRGCRATPAVSEIASFLESLLPDGTGRVPGTLRYTIARARLEVDVRPFDSLHDFARALARHEHGARAAVVRGVLIRAGAPRVGVALSLIERRRPQASVTELRRALREAQALAYEQRPVAAPPIDIRPVRDRVLPGAAACFAAGLALICTGESLHRRQAPIAVPQAAPAIAQAAPAERSRALTAPAALPSGIIAVRDVRPTRAHPTRARQRRAPVRRVSSGPAARPDQRRMPTRNASRGVLDRLRLRWLRRVFVRSDL